MARYILCTEQDIPSGVRFDLPARFSGRFVQVEYGGFSRSEHDTGAPYKRVTDRTRPQDGPTYYRRVDGDGPVYQIIDRDGAVLSEHARRHEADMIALGRPWTVRVRGEG